MPTSTSPICEDETIICRLILGMGHVRALPKRDRGPTKAERVRFILESGALAEAEIVTAQEAVMEIEGTGRPRCQGAFIARLFVMVVDQRDSFQMGAACTSRAAESSDCASPSICPSNVRELLIDNGWRGVRMTPIMPQGSSNRPGRNTEPPCGLPLADRTRQHLAADCLELTVEPAGLPHDVHQGFNGVVLYAAQRLGRSNGTVIVSCPPSAIRRAAQAILDRGWGKAVQALDMAGPEGGPLEIIVRYTKAPPENRG